jgi:hypothetical protein
MGSLAHFSLAAIAEVHGLRSFVETGTGDGTGVAQALAAGFPTIYSIELVPALAAAARARFAGEPRVTIEEGDSAECLEALVPRLPSGPAFFWLDAHFPGADYRLGGYADEGDAGRRLPLEREVAVLARLRAGCGDVLVIDDARIYQPGPYAAGDLPADWPALAGVTRSLDFVRAAFGRTHGVVVDYADQGYVMVVPHARHAPA